MTSMEYTKCATFSLLEEGILVVRLLENSDVDLEESKQMQRKSLQMTSGKRFVSLIDARVKLNVTKESREWGSTPEAQKNMIAQAIVVTSLANKLVGNFIIQVHKPKAKTRMFSDESQAIAWLKDQLLLEQGN